MKAIVLAAGKSSRFWPLAYNGHKSLLVFLGRPLIQYALDALSASGVEEIAVVYSAEKVKRAAEEWAEEKNYRIATVRQQTPRGMWEAIALGRDVLGASDAYIVTAPHHYQEEIFRQLVKSNSHNILCGAYKADAYLYGRVELENGRVKALTEKPLDGMGGFVLTAIYKLSEDFIDYMAKAAENLEETAGEYILEAAIDKYTKEKPFGFLELEEMPPSYKYPWHSLAILKDLLERKVKTTKILGKVSSTAKLIGPVVVEEGAEIGEYAVIKGPAYIGKEAFVGDFALVRQSSAEEKVLVGARTEVARSLLQPAVHTHGGFIGDSIIGRNTKVGYGVCFANKRLDRKEILVEVKGRKVSAGKSFGAATGRDVSIGIYAGIMPGTLIGSHAKIWPGATVKGRIEEGEKVKW